MASALAPPLAEGPDRFLELLPAQREFMESIAPELLYSGAFGAGKTRILNEKALFLSLRYPGNFGLICRKVMASMTHTTIRSFFGQVCPPGIITHHNKSENILRLPNGSEIIFAGLDNPQKLGSLELGWVAVDEAIETTEADWNMLVGRLRHASVPFRQIFAASNPGPKSHYLHRKFYVERRGTHVVESNAYENVHNPADYRTRLSRMTGMYKQRYVEGKWVNFEGMVYPNFDPNVHIIPSFDIPEDWPRFGSIDFGFVNPFVFQWWAQDPDTGNLYLYRELYRTNRIVSQHAKIIKAQEDISKLSAIWADHDAEDRATLRTEGIVTRRAIKERVKGIQEVTFRLGNYEAEGEDGETFEVPSSLFIFDDALVDEDYGLTEANYPICTTAEVQGYLWDTTRKNREDMPKDDPVKFHDHGCDAMRYAIMGVKSFAPRTLHIIG